MLTRNITVRSPNSTFSNVFPNICSPTLQADIELENKCTEIEESNASKF